MKKKLLMIIAGIMAVVTLFTFASCSSNTEKNILVVCRDAASGTREAFDKFVGLQASELISDKEEYSSTANVREKVATTKTAIGYISLASVDDSVKALKVNGVEATEENVRSGEYKIQRPFLLLTNNSVTLQPAAQDFFNYCMSSTAKDGITATHGILPSDFSSRSEYTVPSTALSGDVVVKGSTSMTDLMEKLIANYKALLGDKVANVKFTISFNGSSEGRTAAKGDTNGTVIGVASSSSKNDAYTETTICLDAVAVIVNKDNDQISNVTAEILKNIYTGKVTKFSEIK